MTIKRETILAQFALALGLERNATIGEFKGQWLSLLDGEIEKIDEFLNAPAVYEWQARPVLLLAVDGGSATSRSAALSALLDDHLAKIEAAKADLIAAGLIDDLNVTAPDFEANNLWGAAGVKVAELIIEIDYWSDQPVG